MDQLSFASRPVSALPTTLYYSLSKLFFAEQEADEADLFASLAELDAGLASEETAALDHEDLPPTQNTVDLSEQMQQQFGRAGVKLLQRQTKKRTGVESLFNTEGTKAGCLREGMTIAYC